MSGLPLDVVTQQRGFVNNGVVKNLRAGEGKIISIYDATFAVDDRFPSSADRTSPIRSSPASRAPMAGRLLPTRATSSASRRR